MLCAPSRHAGTSREQVVAAPRSEWPFLRLCRTAPSRSARLAAPPPSGCCPSSARGSHGWRSHPSSRQRRDHAGPVHLTGILILRPTLPPPWLSRAVRRSERSSLRWCGGERAGSAGWRWRFRRLFQRRPARSGRLAARLPQVVSPSSVRVRQTGGTRPALVRDGPCGQVHRDPTSARGGARPLPRPDEQPELRTASPHASRAGV
jgi:hypothetical protein